MADWHLHPSEDEPSSVITSEGGRALAPDLAESDLLRLAQGGDAAAFEVLYRRHAPRVEMICRARLVREADVADAVQETFARAFRHLPTFQGAALFGHWLSRIARRVAIDAARKAHTRVEVPLEEAAHVRAPTDAPVAALQRLEVGSMLTSLSVRDARLLVSHHVEGWTVRELAARWGLTEGAMAVALQRARTRARDAAVRQSLPALVGITVGRALGWLRARLREVSITAAVVPVLAAAVVLMPMLAPAISAPVPGELDSARRSDAETDASRDKRQKFDKRDDTSRREASITKSTKAGEPAVNHKDTTAGGGGRAQKPVVPFEGVDIPGTGRRLSAERPRREADYEIGAEVQHGDSSASIKVETFDEPAGEPAHDAACTAAEAAPAAVYCERGGSAPTSE